jgi:hypothetical protein
VLTPARRAKRLLIILALGAIAVAAARLYYPYTAAGQQQRNMAAAQQHLPNVQSILSADALYEDVTAEVWTGNGGGLVIRGTLPPTHALADLKRKVEATSPPSSVTWFVTVRETLTTNSSK